MCILIPPAVHFEPAPILLRSAAASKIGFSKRNPSTRLADPATSAFLPPNWIFRRNSQLFLFSAVQCTDLFFQPSAFSMKRQQKRRLIWPESSRTSHRYYLSFRSVEISVRLDWWNHCACNCDKWGTRRGDIWTHTEYSHYPHFTGRIHFQESCGRISIPTTGCV